MSGNPNPPLENLIPYQPGQSGNPAGRPKGARSRSTVLAEYAGLKVKKNGLSGEELEATAEEFAIMALIKKAWEGDVAAIKEIQDTLYGKITDKTELTGAEGSPLGLAVKFINSEPELGNPNDIA